MSGTMTMRGGAMSGTTTTRVWPIDQAVELAREAILDAVCEIHQPIVEDLLDHLARSEGEMAAFAATADAARRESVAAGRHYPTGAWAAARRAASVAREDSYRVRRVTYGAMAELAVDLEGDRGETLALLDRYTDALAAAMATEDAARAGTEVRS